MTTAPSASSLLCAQPTNAENNNSPFVQPPPYFSRQQELCPNCLTAFEADVGILRVWVFISSTNPSYFQCSYIRFTHRCNQNCLKTLHTVPEENRAALDLVIRARLLEQKMESNIFHAVHAFGAALVCETSSVQTLLPLSVLRQHLQKLEEHREALAEHMLYTSGEEERLRGGRAGVVQHLMSPEHQDGLPVWLRGILPVPYAMYPARATETAMSSADGN